MRSDIQMNQDLLTLSMLLDSDDDDDDNDDDDNELEPNIDHQVINRDAEWLKPLVKHNNKTWDFYKSLDMVDSRKGWIIFLLCAINGVYLYTKQRAGELTLLGINFFSINIPSVICFSPTALASPIGHLFVSTLVILTLCTISYYGRNAVDLYIRDPLIRILLMEAIASAELCGCCFELIIVADNFGLFMYALYLFLLVVWWNKVWGDATACPYTHLEDIMQGRQEIQMGLMKVWAELTGGIFVFRLIQFIWSLELVKTHKNRAYEECTADLQVTMFLGALIECAGTFFCQITAKALSDLNTKHIDLLIPFLATSAVAAAFNYSGGYYNPVLATSLKFGCEGNTFVEHFAVYWIGACLGSVLSVLLYERTSLKNYMLQRRANDEIDHEKYD